MGRYGDAAVGRDRRRRTMSLRAAGHRHSGGRPGHLRAGEPAHHGPKPRSSTPRMLRRYFDPVTGEKTAVPSVHPDAAGLWKCPPPAGAEPRLGARSWKVQRLRRPRSKVGRRSGSTLTSSPSRMTNSPGTSTGAMATCGADFRQQALRPPFRLVRRTGGSAQFLRGASTGWRRPFLRVADFEVR